MLILVTTRVQPALWKWSGTTECPASALRRATVWLTSPSDNTVQSARLRTPGYKNPVNISNLIIIIISLRDNIFLGDYEVILTELSREVIPDSDDDSNDGDDGEAEDDVVAESTDQTMTEPEVEPSDPTVEEDNTCRFWYLLRK